MQKSQAEVTLLRSYVDAFLGKYLLGQDAPILDSTAETLTGALLEVQPADAQ